MCSYYFSYLLYVESFGFWAPSFSDPLLDSHWLPLLLYRIWKHMSFSVDRQCWLLNFVLASVAWIVKLVLVFTCRVPLSLGFRKSPSLGKKHFPWASDLIFGTSLDLPRKTRWHKNQFKWFITKLNMRSQRMQVVSSSETLFGLIFFNQRNLVNPVYGLENLCLGSGWTSCTVLEMMTFVQWRVSFEVSGTRWEYAKVDYFGLATHAARCLSSFRPRYRMDGVTSWGFADGNLDCVE